VPRGTGAPFAILDHKIITPLPTPVTHGAKGITFTTFRKPKRELRPHKHKKIVVVARHVCVIYAQEDEAVRRFGETGIGSTKRARISTRGSTKSRIGEEGQGLLRRPGEKETRQSSEEEGLT